MKICTCNEDLRMYILVNKDIEISKGKLAGQVGHAVATYFYSMLAFMPQLIKNYMSTAQKKIILYSSQTMLQELEDRGYIAIRDKGWTELQTNTLTCINLGIVDYNNIPTELEFIKQLKLV